MERALALTDSFIINFFPELLYKSFCSLQACLRSTGFHRVHVLEISSN